MPNVLGQIENSHLQVKLEIRRRILAGLKPTRRRPLRVLDCCAGSGTIWTALGGELPINRYLPIDLKPQLPGTVRMDSRRALASMNLAPFNVIDVDTFGEPWEHWLTLAPRLAPTRVAVFLTHGHITTSRGGTVLSMIARQAMGIPAHWPIPNHPGLQTISASYCLTRGCESVKIHSALRWTSRRVDYYGLLVSGERHRRKR